MEKETKQLKAITSYNLHKEDRDILDNLIEHVFTKHGYQVSKSCMIHKLIRLADKHKEEL